MSRYSVRSKKHILDFRFPAGTSRGILTTKDTWFVIVHDLETGTYGIGESGPLKGLSPDGDIDFDERLSSSCKHIENQLNLGESIDCIQDLSPDIPAVKMGVEMALLDLKNGGTRKIFHNDFYFGRKAIRINGLIWMGDRDFMDTQVIEKIENGFNCIKMKIGAIDHDTEMDILYKLREKYPPDQLIIKVDANGAFDFENVFSILKKLYKAGVHSIEQPIKKGQIDAMHVLCKDSPIPIALDEELIGINGVRNKEILLQEIKPQYIVLKPTLLGGFSETCEWIELANKSGIGWWITSALESNIGLSAICQFTEEFEHNIHQGLGTGQLYKNNINSPLEVDNGMIRYRQDSDWDLRILGIKN